MHCELSLFLLFLWDQTMYHVVAFYLLTDHRQNGSAASVQILSHIRLSIKLPTRRFLLGTLVSINCAFR